MLISIRLHREMYIASSVAAVSLIIALVILLRLSKVRWLGKRVNVSEPCPCGQGNVRVTSGQYGDFLGCTSFLFNFEGLLFYLRNGVPSFLNTS